MDFQQITPYSSTAWNSERYSRQKPRPEQGSLIKLLQGGNPLPWNRANETVPISMIQEPTPAEIKQRIKDNKGETFWDENQCTIGSLNRWGLIYFYITMFAKGFCVFLGPLFPFITIYLYFDDPEDLNGLLDFIYI
ncbi:hypothetical protein SAMN03080615_03961 [Amphritea atlantica]|uniref:Uncharacterized protein n=1 Tax=Amphritea atlantica TaxID=355243 RepID=A0A1H9LHV9_9GAMM|nr:hypothetical protein [Amphritea atlantica]SER10980.1 hypothetical protein SAMN03080615_03961 [Amphritea atlantica]